MIKKVFIIVPSSVYDSPIKGAAALANALSKWVLVTFITLKKGDNRFDLLDDSVEWTSLAKYNRYEKVRILRKMLKNAGVKEIVATVSFGFSADMINSLCGSYASTCASVRGNLPKNYAHTYGLIGRLIAYIHLKRLNKIKHVVSMTDSMAEQVSRYIFRNSPVIGNFIDEDRLEKYRKKSTTNILRFVFTGSFIVRKQPLQLIEAVSVLHSQGIDFILDMFGDGDLLGLAKEKVKVLHMEDCINFHGHVNEPYEYIAKADVLILPSLSEGVPRSVLEALYLGVPCVLRDVDGNRELIQTGENGWLFNNVSELPGFILKTAELSRNKEIDRESLIPSKFRQNSCAKSYLNLISQ